MNFNSHTDAVVAVAAALVNAATPGLRRTRAYTPPPPGPDRIAAITEALRTGSRTVHPLSAAQADALTAHAARLRAVFERIAAGDPDAAASAVNALLADTRPTPYLDRHDGEPWHLHFHSPDDDRTAPWAASTTIALATVLGGEHADRLGVCEAPACDRVFVDTSRNGTRRFCSTACQNRVKAAAHRARTATPPASR